ncbi:MAG: Uma2 family endonuclease [Desulfurococcaceae archaeon]
MTTATTPEHRNNERLFTVGEYHRMAQVGILTEGERTELIDGKIVTMTPIGSRHAACVNRLNQLLAERTRGLAIVSVQNPIALDSYNEPQPDIALLALRDDFYAAHHPRPEDVLLIIEVAESSLEGDRNLKLPLYAKAAIPEVWLVNLADGELESYRQAGATARSRSTSPHRLWPRNGCRASPSSLLRCLGTLGPSSMNRNPCGNKWRTLLCYPVNEVLGRKIKVSPEEGLEAAVEDVETLLNKDGLRQV